MEKFKFLLVLILVKGVKLKFFNDNSDSVLKNLIAYDSVKIKNYHDQPHDYQPETFYYSPYQAIAQNENFTNFGTSNFVSNKTRDKRGADTKFRGRPKTLQEVWSRNFNMSTQEFAQSTSLVVLLNKIIVKYMGACIPVVLYDGFVEKSEGFILQRLFEEFPTSFIHGRINANFTIDNNILLTPPDSKCRSFLLFISDALKTRQVIGPQIENKVIVVPRSTQWKLQEFLSSPSSRDIINLLVIGESYSADKTRERPYVLYTHQLYVDGLGSNKPKVLTSWIKGRLSRPHIDLFPTKLTKGFAGHRFSVAASNFPPFVFKKLSTDGVGNLQIRWDGYEYRILQVLGKRLNFTFDVGEPKNAVQLGPGDSVGEAILKRQFDIGISGMYVTTERNIGMEMSVSHSTDCAAFITLTSKALPRYRAILGPFQWQVWLCLTLTYLVAIIPLAYSDSLSIRYLIEKPGQIENMFWYVFGTFTNSLTFSGEMSWSNSRKTSTRLLIGFYWVFTIIITACYTGSIIAFVTLPVYPETVDSLSQLQNGFYRIGTLDRGGWERWFLNSSQRETAKLLKNLEFVKDLEEGLSNVTKAYFLFPYAFVGSKSQLEYVIQTNYTDDKLGRRSALHISDECFALFGVSISFQQESVYRQKLNDGLLMLLQSGIVQKIKNDVRWDMVRSSAGGLLQISTGKTLKMTNQEERGLTLADTEGMFLLLGIGFLIAGGALISEWVGGCTNKCMQIMKIKKEQKQEEHRMEEEAREDARLEEVARVDAEDVVRHTLESASSVIGITFNVKATDQTSLTEIVDDSPPEKDLTERKIEIDSNSSRSSRHSRSSSLAITDLNAAMLTEMFNGPKSRPSNIVMIDGKMMSECDAAQYANDSKKSSERDARGSEVSDVSKTFSFLKHEDDDEEDDNGNAMAHVIDPQQVCHVEINLQAPTPSEIDNEQAERFFGEKIEKPPKKSKKKETF